MPTIELDLRDLEKLLGKKLPRTAEALDSAFECVKAEVEEISGNNLKLEIKGNDRPDIWNVEGVARQMKGQVEKEIGLKKYKINNSRFEVKTKGVKVRPYIACAVVKNIKITPYILEQLIQQQEKIHGTYGRNRKRASIGLYNFDMLKFPLRYCTCDPKKVSFIPLGWTKKANMEKIIKEHEKGKEFCDILKGEKKYPVFLDNDGKVLSFPPIINSNDLGNISTKTKNILVEVTGTDLEVVKSVLNIVVLSLADRGGKIYSVKTIGSGKPKVFPNFSTKKIIAKLDDVNGLLGMEFSAKQVEKLLKRSRYGVVVKGNKFVVEIPCYRTDIMHPVDIIEDIAIAYGFNDFEVDPPELYTLGGLTAKTKFSNKVRDIMIGFGLQEVMTHTLVNKKTLTEKVMIVPKLTEISNPINNNYTCLRNAVIPTMLELLSKNTHNKFPQKIFEVGNCIVNKKDVEKLGCLITHDQANFTEAKAILESIGRNLGIKFGLKPIKHPTFIDGRVGEILLKGKHVGVIGEINPKVLENWGLEKSVIGFEIDLGNL